MKPLYDKDGNPARVLCYDNGGTTFDRYTVIYTGRYRHLTAGQTHYVGMSEHPFHPQGFGQHGSAVWSKLGKGKAIGDSRIPFSALPPDCQRLVHQDYRELWS